ncbi:MAG: BtrH N-terminal domain-containing protein [Candidatus Obscuribacterales bacterium]|nr:BtrH N-terminal domain-containing protein [Steroidobacteraceae bacterium]
MKSDQPFAHRQSAHCESGVVSAMMSYYGIPMSEPMAFGLASALTFAYIPFVKMAGMPLIAYRMPPGAIIRAMQKRMGVSIVRQKFRDPKAGMAALNEQLAQGRIVGLQTCVYWLPYFPEAMRFHFNAHNLIVYGREGDEYLISDPVFEGPVRCSAEALEKARFAKGAMAAKGMMYYPTKLPESLDYTRLLPDVVRRNCRTMSYAPVPIVGIRGIRYLANNIVKLGRRQDKSLSLYLAHIVRMQEEIGTGGAGFRFIYASFLQEAGRMLGNDLLMDASKQMTAAGDEWRRFALHATKMGRGRSAMDVDALANILNTCADREAAMWKSVRSV